MNIIADMGNGITEALPQETAGLEAAAAPAAQVPANDAPAQAGQAPEAAAPAASAEAAPAAAAVEDPKFLALQAQFEEARKRQQEAQEQLKVFEELRAHPGFQKWYAEQNQAITQAAPLLTRDEHVELLSDPAKYQEHFQKSLNSAIQAYHRQYVAPVIQQYERQAAQQAKVGEINAFAAEHEDFWTLADQGGPIEKIMQKYPDIAVEDAYNLAKSKTAQKEAMDKAHQTVEMKKQATVAKPGASGTDRAGQVTVHSDEEAMTLAMQYAKKGQKPPKFIFADAK